MAISDRLKTILVFICLAGALAGCRSRAPAKSHPNVKIKTSADRKKQGAKAPPATLTVTIVDSATGGTMANIPVAVGKRYLATDAGGRVMLGNLSAGDIPVAARAFKYGLYRHSLRLQAGENTATIALLPETGTPEPDPVVYQRQAYLTIDDGPSATWTPAVLDILKKEHVRATFFLVGWRAAKHPEIVRRIYLEGQTIGNHTFSHNYDELYRGSAKNLLASLAANGRLLKAAIGYEPKIMRPPGGASGNFRPGYQSSLTWAGYTTVLWNVSTGDGSTQTTGPQMVANAKRYLDRLAPRRPAVILMHDVRRPITEALPQIIAEVRRRGYEFSVITDDMREPDLILGKPKASPR